MTRFYDVKMEGTAAHGQTWTVSAIIEAEINDVMSIAMEEMFMQLTQGRAVFGHPGVGCDGPYVVQRVLIERSPEQ